MKKLPKLLTFEEASEATGVSVITLRGWWRFDRSFPGIKIKSRIFMPEYDLFHWLKINSKRAAG